MESLLIQATEESPDVNFDIITKQFTISGESRPENAGKLYQHILAWLNEYGQVLENEKKEMKENIGFTFSFKMDYFNSLSAKYIIDILSTLKEFMGKGIPINIEWHYDKRDEDMLDYGVEFAEIAEVELKYIPY